MLFEDEAGQDLKPGKGRTWSRRGSTPLVTVVGKGSGRVLMAGMICVRPGHETRLIYRTQTYRGRTGEKKGFRAREFADLLTSARRQLGDVPLIVVWDNAGTHHAKPLREFCERNSDWPTIVKLPPYAPDLNPVEGVWAHVKKSLANLAPCTIEDLTPLVKNRLRVAVADEGFWDAVRKVSGGTTLLCERWAHGAYGCRWFRVNRENAAEAARLVSPCALLRVVAEPDLRADAEVPDDDSTAFASPLSPGELVHKEYPGGAGSLSDVVSAGFSLLLADAAICRWCAVVPDPDGVNRAQWESPEQLLRRTEQAPASQPGPARFACGPVRAPRSAPSPTPASTT
ncbi:transposase [Streptomyces sp. 900105755]